MKHKNIILTQSQANAIKEDYLYHKGHDIDVDNPAPHYSENRWQKWDGAGHETGSFGSGMYFTSQYPRDERFNQQDKDDIFKAKYDARKDNEKFIQIGQYLYRVNTDFFKNLYKLKSENEGRILEDMMEAINSFVRTFNYPDSRSVKLRQRCWLRISRESKMLGLSIPWDYRGFCDFAQKYCEDQTIRQTPATIFMEMNGFNGVDATNAGKYDSYWQGSVIYDLSKVEKDITPALGPRDETKLAYDFYDKTMTHDVLDNQANPHYFHKDDYPTKDDPQEVLMALKRYGGVLPANKYWSLPEEIKRKYLIVVYHNIKSGFIDANSNGMSFHFRARGGVKELQDKIYINDIIKYGLTQFMNVTRGLTETLLNEFSWGYKINTETVEAFLNAYRGNIAEDYPELYDEICEEYGF